ncbi:MAG: hypothetical protein AB8G15_13695, partial [Saprospiraceae bacterium]
METATISIFFLLLGAAILAAILTWYIRSNQLISLKKELDAFRLKQSDLEIELSDSKTQSLSLKTAVEESQIQQTVANDKVVLLRSNLQNEKENHELVIEEFNTFKASIRNSEKQIHQLHQEILKLKKELTEEQKQTSNWQEKYNTIRTSQITQAPSPPSESSPNQASSNGHNGGPQQKKWESSFKKLSQKYEEVEKVNSALQAQLNVFQGYKSKYDHYLLTMSKKEKELNSLKKELDIKQNSFQARLAEQESVSLQYKALLEGNDRFANELSQTKENYGQLLKDYEKQIASLEIVHREQKKLEQKFALKQKELNKTQKENQKLSEQLIAISNSEPQKAPRKSEVTKNKRSELLARIKERTQELDWSKIGKATQEQRDNLKKLRGLGTFVEQKMNAIGIYNFAQIAKLQPTEEELLNQLLELP